MIAGRGETILVRFPQAGLPDPAQAPMGRIAGRGHGGPRLPLALEVAGAHLGKRPQMPPAAYRQELIKRGVLPVIDDKRGGVSDGDLGTRHAAAVEVTLAEQWEAIENDAARLLLRVAGQLPEAAVIPAARLGLLTAAAEEDGGFFGSPLTLALEELDRLSLVEELGASQVRLHPLVHDFARRLTPEADTPTLRRDCAENLLLAYAEVQVLERQCAQRGIDAVQQDLAVTLEQLAREQQPDTLRQELRRLLRMAQHESHTLRGWQADEQPAHFLQQWRKRALVENEMRQAQAAWAKSSCRNA